MADQTAQTAAAVRLKARKRARQIARVDTVDQPVAAAAGAANHCARIDAGIAGRRLKVQIHRHAAGDVLQGRAVFGVTGHNGHILQAGCRCDHLVGLHAERAGKVDILHRAAVDAREQAAKGLIAPLARQGKIHVDGLVVAVKHTHEVGDTVEGVVLVGQCDVVLQDVRRLHQVRPCCIGNV